MKKLKMNQLAEQNFPITLFTNVGTMMRHEHFAESLNFYNDEIFIFLDKNMYYDLHTGEVPAGTYFSLCCDLFEKEEEYARKLFHELKEKGYSPLGDYLCEVVTEYPNPNNGERKIFYKMQGRIN